MSRKDNNIDPSRWVAQYADMLYRFALQRVNNKHLAEDLVQDSFVSALDALSAFRGDSTEKTWLFTILRNKIIDYYRSSEKKMSSKFYDLDDEKGNDHFFYQEGKKRGEWINEHAPLHNIERADSNIEREEFMNILRKCMDLLPFKWAEVFRMKNLEEKNTKEICKEMKITPSNLWVIVHRAKLQMRSCMDQKWAG